MASQTANTDSSIQVVFTRGFLNIISPSLFLSPLRARGIRFSMSYIDTLWSIGRHGRQVISDLVCIWLVHVVALIFLPLPLSPLSPSDNYIVFTSIEALIFLPLSLSPLPHNSVLYSIVVFTSIACSIPFTSLFTFSPSLVGWGRYRNNIDWLALYNDSKATKDRTLRGRSCPLFQRLPLFHRH